MTTVKRYMALCLVFSLIVAGVLLLIVDCESVKGAWLTLSASLVCLAMAVVLARVFNRRNMLPE